MNGYSLGGIYHIPLLSRKTQNLSLGIKGVVTYSTLDLISYNRISTDSNEHEINLHSIDYGGGATLIYQYPISILFLRISLGADRIYGDKLRFRNDRKLFVENNSGKPVRTGWSGLRTGIGVAIPF